MEIITARDFSWAQKLLEVKNFGTIEFDRDFLTDEFDKFFDGFVKGKILFEELENFLESTGYKLSSDDVQAKYRSIWAGPSLRIGQLADLFAQIEGLTNVKPSPLLFDETKFLSDPIQARETAKILGIEITSDMIQRMYARDFEANGYIRTSLFVEWDEPPNEELVDRYFKKVIDAQSEKWIGAVRHLEDELGMGPSQEEIQYAYQLILVAPQHLRLGWLRDWKQFSGVPPAYDAVQVDPIYDDYLKKKEYQPLKEMIGLTGIAPDAAQVRAAALGIVAYDYYAIDNGKRINDSLIALSECVGVGFEITESEIQDLYKQAIEKRNPRLVINLHGAFGIRPIIGKEIAHEFLVAMIGDASGVVPDLEVILETKTEATPAEIDALYDQRLAQFKFDSTGIEALTGRAPRADKVQAAIEQLAETKYSVPIKASWDGDSTWESQFSYVLKEFEDKLPEAQILSFYQRCVDGESVDIEKIRRLNKLLNRQLPADLAQLAYQKIIKSRQSASSVDEIYAMSGHTQVDIAPEEMGVYLLDIIENGRSVESNNRFSEIIGKPIVFEPEAVQGRYKKLIFDGKFYSLAKMREVTGIELTLDQETVDYVSKKIKDTFDFVTSYDILDSDGKRLDINPLRLNFQATRALIVATGVELKPDLVATTCAKIAEEDQYWQSKLYAMKEYLGVEPHLSAEIVARIGAPLIAEGDLGGLKELLSYGEVQFAAEAVWPGYHALLEPARLLDDRSYSKKDEYRYGWLYEMKTLYDLTHVLPSPDQLAQIFEHIHKDRRLSRGDGFREDDKGIKLMQEQFGANVYDVAAQSIYLKLFGEGDWQRLAELKKATGIVPIIPPEEIEKECRASLVKLNLQQINLIQDLLDLESSPLTPDIVQSVYGDIMDSPDFEKQDKYREIDEIFKRTGIKPVFSAEQLSRAYRHLLNSAAGDRFEQIVGVPPSAEDLQNQVYLLLSGGWFDPRKVTAFVDKHKLVISEDAVRKAVEKQLSLVKNLRDFIAIFSERMKLIGSATGAIILISSEKLAPVIENITAEAKNSSHEVLRALEMYQLYAGRKPSKKMIELAYMATVTSFDYLNANSNWEELRRKYGQPTEQTIQKIYLAQLLAE